MEGYGPDNPPPKRDGIGPDPASEGPPEYNTTEPEPRDFQKVPLDAEDRYIAEKHAHRIRSVEPFGAVAAANLKITGIKRKPDLDAPSS